MKADNVLRQETQIRPAILSEGRWLHQAELEVIEAYSEILQFCAQQGASTIHAGASNYLSSAEKTTRNQSTAVQQNRANIPKTKSELYMNQNLYRHKIKWCHAARTHLTIPINITLQSAAISLQPKTLPPQTNAPTCKQYKLDKSMFLSCNLEIIKTGNNGMPLTSPFHPGRERSG